MREKQEIREDTPKGPLLLSGNEAIARGAIEAGVALVTGYPGTPSTDVIETLLRVPDLGFRVEWAINEKVAFELATGVSWSGLRSLVTMKMSGLNVAADAFLSVQYSGVRGGLVLYVADDPNTYYGMVEQDSRHYARLAAAPMLMPASPQEALDFTRRAFHLSEEVGRPVMLLGTTTLAHSSEMVTAGSIEPIKREPAFEFNIAKYAKAGPLSCVEQHRDTLLSLDRFGLLADDLNLLALGENGVGVVAAGVTWNYLQEVMQSSRVNPSTLKVGVVNPLPLGKIRDLLSKVRTVVVLEELEPLVEEAVWVLRGEIGHPVKVLGKIQGPLSRTGDYGVETVASVLREVYGKRIRRLESRKDLAHEAERLRVQRLNTFCAGCPHRATYYALNRAIEELGYQKNQAIITGDIGCTILGMNEPFRSCWTEISMGSSISLAQGFRYAGIQTPVVATIGDGTFFHGGIPALLNASHHRANLTVLILDNHWASMTGMQPNVGTVDTSARDEKRSIRVEDVVKASGVRNVWRINPFQIGKMIGVLKEAISSADTAVVIAEAECTIQKVRRRKSQVALKVSPERCIGLDACKPSCVEILGCPALDRGEDGKVFIDPDRCRACGLCRHVCAYGAI